MNVKVLSVAYPLALVGPNQVGGAEQILSALDRALVAAGHHSLVIAADGSEAAGTLIPLPRLDGVFDEDAVRRGRQHCRSAIRAALLDHAVDVVHMHGVDFHEYLPPQGPPVLATLHLPASWYPRNALCPQRPATWLNCVSRAQHATCGNNPHLLEPIPNGVPVEGWERPKRKRSFVLVLGRICPEKGIHIALEVAEKARVPLVLAGQVFPYPDHAHYFEQMVKPRLSFSRRYIGPIGFARKRALLAQARCLLITSLVPETSSLVALEALAAGTPVVAFGKGALPEAIDHGRTGYLAWDSQELLEGVRAAATIDPEACRATARQRFSADRMIERYFQVYQSLARNGSERPQLDTAA
jgi:glycosyltransferase involved in cell wall biosynthesis